MHVIVTRGCDSGGVPDLTPAQAEVLALLRAADEPRPEVPVELRDELRRTLERGIGDLAAALDRPLVTGKAGLARVLACEAHHLDEEATPFEWSLPTARGTVAHKAIQLSVHRRDRPSPGALVDDAIDRLADDPDAPLAGWLLGLPEAERADLRSDVQEIVAGFLELWPPLQASWRPQTESPRRAELCGGRVVVSCKVDLTLGAPVGRRAGRVVVDLKTGSPQPSHRDDLRLYSLLDTLRVGVPPFSAVGYYLDSATFSVEPVSEDVLDAAVRRTVAALRRLVELRLGVRSPVEAPGPTCRWCRRRTACSAVAAAPDDDTGHDSGDDDW